MDLSENLSARVLLNNILYTERTRTPINRSASKIRSHGPIRRSARLIQKNAGAQSPLDLLRLSLKRNMRKSINMNCLHGKRSSASIMTGDKRTPAPTSIVFDDGVTPRHILMNVLQTEPVTSPAVRETAASEETEQSSADSSITSKSLGTDFSLTLPDITIADVASTAKGLSRKRPRQSLNVTAFEKRLKDGGDIEKENEETIDDHSSLSLSSCSSLSLKTPVVDVQTEKRGMERRVSNRRKITEDEFAAAVNKRQRTGASSFGLVGQGLSETAHSEGFTLGLSKLGEPDITTDIVHCDKTLHTHPDAMTTNFSSIATRVKSTVLVSHFLTEMEQEELMEVEQSKLEKEKSMYVFPTEEGVVSEPQNEKCFSQCQSEEDVGAAESQNKEGSAADDQPEDAVAMSTSEEGAAESHTSVKDNTAESEEDENRVEAQTEEEGAAESHTSVKDNTAESEEDENRVEAQTEEEGAAESQTEEGEGAVYSQTKEEGSSADSQPEYGDDGEPEEEDGEPEEEDGEPEEEDGEQASEQLERDLEHISRRTHRSEARLIELVTEAGGDLADATEAGGFEGKSKAHRAIGLHSSLGMGSQDSRLHTGIPDWTESSNHGQMDASCSEVEANADEETSFPLPEVAHDTEDGLLSDDSSEEAAAQDPAEQEEEWEDWEDGEGNLRKIPSFVRRRASFHYDALASTSVPKNIKTSAAGAGLPPPTKPKQVRKRRTGPAKKEEGIPQNYLMRLFRHFAKIRVSAKVKPVLKEIVDKFLDRMVEDLETYALHAKRKSIEVEDAVLLLKRQRHVNDKVTVEMLIEKYLRMDQRRILIPMATPGKGVFPKPRW